MSHPQKPSFFTVKPMGKPNDTCLKAWNNVLKVDSRAVVLWFLTLVLCLGQIACQGADPAGKSASRETLIRVSSEKDGMTTHLYVENVQSAEVTVTMEMDLVNLAASLPLPCTKTLAGKTKVEMFTMSPVDVNRGWSWTYTYFSTFGSTAASHDDTYIYSLPYSPGKSYRVSQGYNGEYSHFGADQYAIDWRMPLGTPVHAARGGVVVGVKNDSDIGGDASKYDWDANYVLIRHSDGTLGQYVHLQKGGTSVKIGQTVGPGEFLGLSGNTGHSTGPHLHFSVFKATDGKHRQTIPVRYRTADDLVLTLSEGKSYKASGMGSPAPSVASTSAKQNSPTFASSDRTSPAAQAKDLDPASARGGKAVGH